MSPNDAAQMVALTPTGRLAWLAGQPDFADASEKITDLLQCYGDFLRLTENSEPELVARLMNPDESRIFSESASKLGDSVFQLLRRIGRESPFYRLLVV